MMWLAVLLIVGGLAWFAVGFVLVTNGTAVAPRRRTDEDPPASRGPPRGWRGQTYSAAYPVVSPSP
ncbi:hypothetical protein LAUMK41_02969 [Mycobacterium attenuatum]|nr:hypothetical protein LAUMK41_02969 [Mycobacterium attenuatum]